MSEFSLLFVHEALRWETQPPPPSEDIALAAPGAWPEKKEKKKTKPNNQSSAMQRNREISIKERKDVK